MDAGRPEHEIHLRRSGCSRGRQFRHTKPNTRGSTIQRLAGLQGMRPDFVDFATKTIYELKPYDPRGIRSGLAQLERYQAAFEQQFGGVWNTVLDLY